MAALRCVSDMLAQPLTSTATALRLKTMARLCEAKIFMVLPDDELLIEPTLRAQFEIFFALGQVSCALRTSFGRH
jgi:hypothetical protein